MSQFFGKAVHAAFVVPDIEKSIQRVLASGIGPVHVMRRIRVPGRYRGERKDVLMTAAFVYTGSMQYEFVQQHDDTPSAYLEFLDKNPQGGFHHLAYFCNGFDEALGRAEEQGTKFDIVQEFISPDDSAYEMYVEPTNVDDPLLVQLMIPSPLSTFFDDMEKIAANWNGEDPVRNAFDLLDPAMSKESE